MKFYPIKLGRFIRQFQKLFHRPPQDIGTCNMVEVKIEKAVHATNRQKIASAQITCLLYKDWLPGSAWQPDDYEPRLLIAI